jgi:hypothetical protein
MKLSHEDRGRDTLPGHVTDEEEEAVRAGPENVAIIATDGMGGLVVVVDLPAGRVDAALGQEAALDVRGEVEIHLERPTLVRRQVVEAILDERVGRKPVGFDGIVASCAKAEHAVIEAGQGGVHFLEELGKPGLRGRSGHGRLKTFPAKK